MPGTNHVLIQGHASSDGHRQHKYVKTIIDNVNNSHSDAMPSHPTSVSDATAATSSSPTLDFDGPTFSSPSRLRQEPFCFVVDTDSVSYIIDTGANRIIVNDAKLLKTLTPTSDKIRGIRGKCIRIAGTGTLDLPLKSNNGDVDKITDLPAVYVPSCPYNLLPPQLLISEMKQRGFAVQHSEHDDTEYIFHYQPPINSKKQGSRTLTLTIGPNNLYTLRTNDGFVKFMRKASSYLHEFGLFAGASHVTPDDKDDDYEDDVNMREDQTIPSSSHGVDKMREITSPPSPSPDTLRENSSPAKYPLPPRPRTCIPVPIPYCDADFETTRTVPTTATFTSKDTPSQFQEDRSIEIERQKQLRLLTIHERLGHVSFSILKLLARCGVIPRDLANLDQP